MRETPFSNCGEFTNFFFSWNSSKLGGIKLHLNSGLILKNQVYSRTVEG